MHMRRMALVLSCVLVLALFGCAAEKPITGDSTEPIDQVEDAVDTDGEVVDSEKADEAVNEVILTLEELKAYDGTNGMPAYVAVEGVIYDVSDHEEWLDGEHGGNMAGTDITETLLQASHGFSKLEGLPVVGKVGE